MPETKYETKTLVFATPRYWRVLLNWWIRASISTRKSTIIYSYGPIFTALAKLLGETRMVRRRNRSIEELWRDRLEKSLHHLELGQQVVLCDLDAIVEQDFVPTIENVTGDIVSSQGTSFPREAHKEWGFVLCCGFMVFRPTESTRVFLKRALSFPGDKFTDQKAINLVLLEAKVKWDLPNDSYQITEQGKTITCFESPVSGRANDGGVNELHVQMLPHSQFRRLPNSKELKTPTVFHPLPIVQGPKGIVRTLKANSLWGNSGLDHRKVPS